MGPSTALRTTAGSHRRRDRSSRSSVVTSSGLHSIGELGPGDERHRSEHLDELPRRNSRGRPASDEPARHRREVGQRLRELTPARVQIAVDQVIAVGPRRERAVVAPVPAERHVHVDAEVHFVILSSHHARRTGRSRDRRIGQPRLKQRPSSSSRWLAPSTEVSRMQAMARRSSRRMVRTRPLKS